MGVGQAAPTFSATTLDGETLSLDGLRGRPVIVNFWGPSCIPCRDEFPLLIDELAAHEADGLAIVGVLTFDPPEPARDFVTKYGATWPTVIDADESIRKSYLVAARPQTYFIDRDGVIRAIQVGEMLEADFNRHWAKIAGVTDATVAVDGLVKRYDGRAVLDGVSFAIGRGELVALLGPNGAGKTTTIEIIEGYRRADGGRIEVLGADPLVGGPDLRARVGLMLQGGGGIDPRTTPAEALRLFARFHEPARDPDELLDLVGLRPVARTRFRRLSGGERQRLALALALVGEPELLLLDEPTAGMDPAARAAARRLIRDLRAAGVTILLTTHDLGDVEALADRVLVLDGGRLVADGPPASIGASASGQALRLRGSAPIEPAALAAALAPGWPEATVRQDGERLDVSGVEPSPALVAAIAGWCADHEILIVELAAGGGSLEKRYLALTGDTSVEHMA